jgi:hypothetical protein
LLNFREELIISSHEKHKKAQKKLDVNSRAWHPLGCFVIFLRFSWLKISGKRLPNYERRPRHLEKARRR